MHRSALFSFVVGVLAVGCGDSDGHGPTSPVGPVGVGQGVRVFSGKAEMLPGGDACTAEEGAEGDRWCAFVARSSEATHQLFVLNVSQVMAGVPVNCDAPDPNCLFLTEDVRSGDADWHRTFFEGDTLVYYDALFDAYAWRPGMEAPRLLARRTEAVDIAFCTPASHGLVVSCLAVPFEQPDGDLVVADLYAGTVDGESEPLVQPIDSVIAATRADQGGVHRFSVGSPASGYLAWSSRQTPDGPEVLKLQQVGDPTSQITVASDVHAWNISADGSEWLWLRAADEKGIGGLQTALFPDGSSPRDLLADVWDFGLDRSGSLAAITGGHNVVSILDPVGAPDDQLLIDSGAGALVSLSDQGHVAYAKHFAGTEVDLFVSTLDATQACMLDASGSVPITSVHFAPGAGTALFALAKAQGYDAYHSRLADCTTAPVAPDIVILGWMNRSTAVFMDQYDSAHSSGSMRFRKLSSNGTLEPTPATLIAEHVDYYATFGPALLYTVNAGTEGDGVWVRAFGP